MRNKTYYTQLRVNEQIGNGQYSLQNKDSLPPQIRKSADRLEQEVLDLCYSFTEATSLTNMVLANQMMAELLFTYMKKEGIDFDHAQDALTYNLMTNEFFLKLQEKIHLLKDFRKHTIEREVLTTKEAPHAAA